MATHFSILAGRIPWTEEPNGPHRAPLSTGESRGQRSPMGSIGSQESDTTERLNNNKMSFRFFS